MSDDEKVLGHLSVWLTFNRREKWIGIRMVREHGDKEEKWANRKGTPKTYLLNILPMIGFVFESTRWTPIKQDKKKK